MSPFPLFLDLRGRPVLVLGNGPVAARKAALLERFGAVIRRCEKFDPPSLAGCALAVGADAAECDLAALSQAAQLAGIPVNVVDRPALCSVLMPAIVDRAPIVVAISSGGAAPVLARQIRSRIEALLPPSLGRLADFLDALKPELRGRFADPETRRRAIERILAGPAADAALAGDPARARLDALREMEATASAASGIVHLVGAGPGEPDLLTLRAQRVMGEADVLVHDPAVPAAVLDMARRDAERVADPAPTARMIALGRAGRRVVRLAGGARPAMFAAEAAALRAAGIAVNVVPGADSY